MLTLAPDPVMPQRDALLDPGVVARLFGTTASCERVHAKYRVGESLRVAYRLAGNRHVAARTFRDGAGAAAYERAHAAAVPAGPLPPVLHARGLDAVFWTFPNDRRLATLPLLTSERALGRLLGRPVAAIRLVAYAPERSASARCLDASGRAVAYVKVHATVEHERRWLAAAAPLVPRVIAASPDHDAIALAPVEGHRLDGLRGGELAGALAGLGRSLATLHTATPVPAERFTRLEPERLGRAAAVIALARPDAGPAAAHALTTLDSRRDEAPGPDVCLHGDANLRNAIANGSRVALLDLEHAAAGPAAADLGQLLAALTTARVLGHVSATDEQALADALLHGYASVTPLPETGSLHWHTGASLLARIAQSAVNRVREDALQRLGSLLEAAAL